MRLTKKGSFADLFFIVPVFFMVAVIIFIFYAIFSQINAQVQANDGISTEGKTIISNAKNKYIAVFDNIFLVLFIFVLIFILVLAASVDINPIFFPLSIILYIGVTILAAILGNVYYHILSDPSLQSYALEFTIIPFVFNNLVKIMIGEAILLGVVMYGKQQ